MTAIRNNDGVIAWKLKDTMDAHGVTRYALQKDTGIALNTIRAMYDGDTQRPDLALLDKIIGSLRRLTGQDIVLSDVLVFTPEREA